MFTTRPYNEAYLLTSKKIKEDFQKDEEKETIKYIDDLEQLVSSTKLILKSLVNGDLNYDQLHQRLSEIEQDLITDCNALDNEVKILQDTEKVIEENTIELEKQEKESYNQYSKKIQDLKKELEVKEFKIQNMERLYVELEDIIKENLNNKNEQLLSLEQFEDFISQNNDLKQECLRLEAEKEKCIGEYNTLLKQSINMKSKDESFELEKIKDSLELMNNNNNFDKACENKILKLNEKYNSLNKECEDLNNNIKRITNNLDSLNLDNQKLNKELELIKKEIKPKYLKRNNSFSNDQQIDILNNNSLFN